MSGQPDLNGQPARRSRSRGPRWWPDLRRYVVAGVAAAATDFTLFLILRRAAGLHPLVANLISRPVGAVVSFAINKRWTFRRRRQRAAVPVQFVRFWVVWLTCYAISEAGLALWLTVLPRDHMVAKALADLAAGLVSFLLLRHWTFD